MKRILSIDFDWIMRPYIEMYNDVCGASANIDDLRGMWEFIDCKLQGFELHCCEAQFADLALFLKKITDTLPAEHLHFILHHDSVIQVLNQCNITEPISLTNVDHHHDFGYPPKDSTEPFDQYVTVANWVRCLWKEDRLEHYTWVGNENSAGVQMVADSLHEQFSFYTDLRKIDQWHFDEIIICFSQEWIPPMVRPLFYVLKELIDRNNTPII